MSAIHTAPPDRVLGWDLLRGWCALGIAIYHLMAWQKVADIHSLGFYGVYLFFVLSGASLTLNYRAAFDREGATSRFGQFLFVRYMRLAPLYAVLVLVSAFWKFKATGLTPDLAGKILTNLSFTFGFASPLTQSMVVGGWSLGIEFIFYLLFPAFLAGLGGRSGWRPWWVLAALLVLQAVWISFTAALDATSVPSLAAYHQVPAFAGYFFGGCVIGWLYLQRRAVLALGGLAGTLGLVLGALLLVALNDTDSTRVLFGWRAVLLCALCFVLVWWAGQIRLDGIAAAFARHFGDMTYGVYLLHPFIYFGLAWVVAPRLPGLDLSSGRWASALPIGAGILVLTIVLALGSERWFEQPIRRFSRRVLAR